MLTVLWDFTGILLVEFIPHKQTINAQYYIEIKRRLHEAIVKKLRGLLARGPYLLHDNAPSHKVGIAQDAIRHTGLRQLDHPLILQTWPPPTFTCFRI